ncbi:MAG: hypothetical protein JO273_06235 [Methylobacteriaceae bacterium]|nr:hypothetical protein [Methylobacteriaceae bacterium]
MADLDDAHHVFRHIKKSWMDGEFIEPAAFRLRERNGAFEEGLSVNWVEYFRKRTARETIRPLRDILIRKGRSIGGESKFALLNVGAAKSAAARFVPIAIITDEEPDDPSHALVKGYSAFNDQVAEELQKIIIVSFPAKA